MFRPLSRPCALQPNEAAARDGSHRCQTRALRKRGLRTKVGGPGSDIGNDIEPAQSIEIDPECQIADFETSVLDVCKEGGK